MTQEEAIRRIENHIRIHSKQEPFRACHIQEALEMAVDALKAHEPVEPKVAHDGWYRCGNCNNSLASGERVKHFYGHPWPKYCEECGRAVKWDD